MTIIETIADYNRQASKDRELETESGERIAELVALAARRLEEVNYLKMTIHCLFNDYGRHMSAEWKKALRPILGITVSNDD